MGDTGVMDPGQWRQWFRIDDTAGTALFDQIRSQIVDGVQAGTLAPGTRLPTVRDLAAELGLAVNTVARAYRELESAGVVETRRRFGTFIARTDPTDATLAGRGRQLRRHRARLGTRPCRGAGLCGVGVRRAELEQCQRAAQPVQKRHLIAEAQDRVEHQSPPGWQPQIVHGAHPGTVSTSLASCDGERLNGISGIR